MSEDVPKRLRPRPYAGVSPEEWKEIRRKLERDPYPSSVGARPTSQERVRAVVMTPEGERDITITRDVPRGETRFATVTAPGAEEERQRGIYRIVTGPPLGKPNQVAPCVPDVYQPRPGYVCGECTTVETRNGEDNVVTARHCKNIPEIVRCTMEDIDRQIVVASKEPYTRGGEQPTQLSVQDKVEVALDCAKGAGLPPSVAAHLTVEPHEEAWNVLDNMIDEGKATKREPTMDEMSSDKHPRFWFGEPHYYKKK